MLAFIIFSLLQPASGIISSLSSFPLQQPGPTYLVTAISKPIVSASPTCHNMALATLVNVLGKCMMTLLTLVLATSRSPGFVCAFMILHQVSSLSFDASLARSRVHTADIAIPVNNGVGPSKKTIFLPLWARTSLPTVTTKVTELGSAITGFDINQ